LDEGRFAALACGDDDTEAWANGRLIAAAPELYEAAFALREAQKAYMNLRGTGASDQQKNERGRKVAEAAAVMDAALRKARGETA
jgi:hypothetical protein